MTATSLIS